MWSSSESLLAGTLCGAFNFRRFAAGWELGIVFLFSLLSGSVLKINGSEASKIVIWATARMERY